MKRDKCQVSHPYIVNDTKAETGSGKEPPSLGSGGPSNTAGGMSLIPTVGRLPFEQQPKESAKAFAAFREYLDLGHKRSLALVGEKLGKSEGLIERWASKFDWVARVRAHSAYLAELERAKIEELVTVKAVEWVKIHESVKREAWREAEETIVMVRKARAEWLAKGRLPGWEGMARMLELAFKLKQFAAGMPSEVKEVHTTFEGKLEVEWEIALRKAYGGSDAVDVQTQPASASEPEKLKEGQ